MTGQAPQQNPLVPVPINLYPFKNGVNSYADRTTIPDDYLVEALNVYPFRGRMKKQMGSTSLGRLRRAYDEITYLDSENSTWEFNLLVESGWLTNLVISGGNLIATTNGVHGLAINDNVLITGVVSSGNMATDVNGNTYLVSAVTDTTFTFAQATTGTYTSGGFWISDASLATNEPNAELECGSVVLTFDGVTFTDQGDGTLLADTDPGDNRGTVDYTSGDIVITHVLTTGVASTLTYGYYPALPVMQLGLYDEAVTNEAELVAFDQHYSYVYDQSTASFSQRGTKRWDGDNKDFFWSYIYQSEATGSATFRQLVTNFNIEQTNVDAIQYWDGTDWVAFTPDLDGTNSLFSCQFLLEYQGRLCALDTWEGTTAAGSTRFQNRFTCSALADPFGATAWRIDNANKGLGYQVDAPTSSAIRTVGFHNDQLIVGFANGESYYLKYTGNDLEPFLWVGIQGANEFGGIAPFGTVSLPEGEFMIGPNGASVINSREASRLDLDIPDWVFGIQDDENGGQRTHSIKDLQRELIYVTYPRGGDGRVYPDRMACYNYREKSWTFLNGQWTCFGYYQKFNDYTWDTLPYDEWDDWDTPWGSARSQAFYTEVIAGNQVGYVHILNSEGESDASFAITEMADSADINSPAVLTIPEHNLIDGESIVAVLSEIVGSTQDEALNDVRVRLVYISSSTVGVQTLVDGKWDNYFLENSAYLGCGRVAFVHGFSIKTKAYSPFYPYERQVRFQYPEVLANVSEGAEITWKIFLDNLDSTAVIENPMGLGIERNQVAGQSKTWHRVDANIEGQYLQLELTQTDEQLGVAANGSADIEFHGLKIMTRPGKRFI